MTRKIEILTIVAVAVLFYIVGRESGMVNTHTDDKKTVDSLMMANNGIQDRMHNYVDSVFEETLAREEERREWQSDRDSLENMLRDLKNKKTIVAYRNAVAVKDTAAALASCDTLAYQYEQFQLASFQEIAEADSIITSQYEDIKSLKTAVIDLRTQADSAIMNSRSMHKQYNDLFKDYKKKTNWWNRWGKAAAAGIVGGLIVHTIMQ